MSELCFGRALDQMGQKCPYLAKNVSFGPNLAVFWPKIYFLGGWSKSLSILISGNQWDTFSVLKTLTDAAQIGRLGQKCAILDILGQKSEICHTTPLLVDGPFVALGETVHFPPWEQFFDFSFSSYGCFLKKKLGRRLKKSSPSPLWEHCLPVTALALSARRLDQNGPIEMISNWSIGDGGSGK